VRGRGWLQVNRSAVIKPRLTQILGFLSLTSQGLFGLLVSIPHARGHGDAR
jgi:hypothetical protein